MTYRHPVALVAILAMGLLAQAPPAAGQAQDPETPAESDAYEPPRMPDGRPDLQGFWTTQTFTPMERPEHLVDKAFYTAEEVASLNAQLTADGVDPLARHAIAIEDPEERDQALYQTNRDEDYLHYDNELWLRTPVPKGLSTRRTSLVTTPDGRIPPGNAQAEQRAAVRAAAREDRGAFDGYELRPLQERCIAWTHNGPPMLPPAYNDVHQIFQTEDYVVVFTELSNHMPRIIPVDGRPHISERIRQLPGDSRGRWEGDTLVVETTHFTDKTRFEGSSENLHVIERFARISDTEIRYEWTVSDPSTWNHPWGAEIPMIATEGPMYEYACHEGNYDIRHILEIYRNIEAQEAAGER